MNTSFWTVPHGLFIVFAFCLLASCTDEPGAGTPSTTAMTADAGEDTCEIGLLTCPCSDDGLCAEGMCLGGVCLECDPGAEDCPCFGNNTCNEGLRCSDVGDLCEACPLGEETCACGAGDICRNPLVCVQELCVAEDCENTPGRDGCPCDEGSCEDDLVCTEGGMCASCSPDFVDCPCDDEDACGNDLICDEDDTICREEKTCEDAACVANQQCDEGEEGADALCLEACLPGFAWNGATLACDRLILANCDSGSEGSILDDCTALNRDCEPSADGAECGACASGFTDENGALMSCRTWETCQSLNCSAQNRACTDQENADVVCGACDDGFQDDGGLCIPAVIVNCGQNDPGSILAECDGFNRLCDEAVDTASCGRCKLGFTENQGLCVAEVECADLDCEARGLECSGEPLAECGGCLPDLVPVDSEDPNSDCRIATTCQGVGGVGSACTASTDCIVGGCFNPDGDGCEVGEEGCADIEGECACGDDGYCSDSNGDAFCANWPCTDNNGGALYDNAFNATIGQCMLCTNTCPEGDALTGSLEPVTTADGQCVCETKQGYYYDLAGNIGPRACDADGDGWISAAARSYVDNSDPVLSENARCDVRMIDRFVLKNEWGQSRSILLCEEGLIPDDPCASGDACGLGQCLGAQGRCDQGEQGCTCGCVEFDINVDGLPLYEERSIDNEDWLLEDTGYTALGLGRDLETEELNSLTRACVNRLSDFNANSVADINEWHLMEPPDGDSPETNYAQELFSQFSYMMELHKGWYEPDSSLGVNKGRYIIAERSRCELDFPVGYDEDLDGDYWRECTRNRDANYNSFSEDPLIGFDFAQWSCDDEVETCPLPEPITEVSLDGEISPHGLCEIASALPPADGVWRGMNHHSQFKCIEVHDSVSVTEVSPDERSRVLLLDELNNLEGETRYQFNRCYAHSDPEHLGEESTLPNTNSPSITCIPAFQNGEDPINAREVGFVSVRYNAVNGYENGCVNEWSSWRELCPGYEENPNAVEGEGNQGNFGKLLCGCGFNYTGLNCDVSCPGAQAPYQFDSDGIYQASSLHFGGTNDDPSVGACRPDGYCALDAENDGPSGYWMCGDFAASSFTTTDSVHAFTGTDATGQGVILTGDVSNVGFEQAPLCQSGDCSSGWKVQ